MKIGLDFDNTIVSYDTVFRDVAVEWKAIPKETPASKVFIRDFLKRAGKEDMWTEMQGYVYGMRMDDAQVYPGFKEFMGRIKNAGHAVAIISHKTLHPFLGPKYDLHASARQWIEKELCLEGRPFFDRDTVFFEPTKEKKLARIANFGCDIFIDDLPELISSPLFPKRTSAILFDPEKAHHAFSVPQAKVLSSWSEIQGELCP